MKHDTRQLKICPFCGYEVHIESSRDWHKLVGPHEPLCPLEDHELCYAGDQEGLAQLRRDWNRRAQLDSGEWVKLALAVASDESEPHHRRELAAKLLSALPQPPEETK